MGARRLRPLYSWTVSAGPGYGPDLAPEDVVQQMGRKAVLHLRQRVAVQDGRLCRVRRRNVSQLFPRHLVSCAGKLPADRLERIDLNQLGFDYAVLKKLDYFTKLIWRKRNKQTSSTLIVNFIRIKLKSSKYLIYFLKIRLFLRLRVD